jgi:N utilization substance protein A
VRLAAKLLAWKIDIKSEEEKRQEVEQQMQGVGSPATAIEQVSELGESIIQKLVAAGITTVEALADMTPEQLEEIPGIGEKTLEKISVAVRHYFGEYEPGEERPASVEVAASANQSEAQSEEAAVEAAEAASDASLAEEEEALRLDLTQDVEEPASAEGTRLIDDEVAEEELAEITETGDELDTEGADSVAPGTHDLSERLRETKVDEDIAEPGEFREEDDKKQEGDA